VKNNILLLLPHPQADSAKNLLKNMLNNSGILYSDCSVLYLNSSRGFADLYEDKKKKNPTEKLLKMRAKISEKIAIKNPNIVVCFGSECLKAITNYNSVTAWRGSVIIGDHGQKILPTYQAEGILKLYGNRPICELDLSKAKRESYSREFDLQEPTMTLLPSYGQVIEWFDQMYQDNPDRVAFDIETTYETFIVRSIGLAYKIGEEIKTISVPFTVSSPAQAITNSKFIKINNYNISCLTPYFFPLQEVTVLDLFAKLFANEKIAKVGQNSVAFDQVILEELYGFVFKNHMFDTMHAHHLCYLEFPKSLDFMTTFYTRYPNYWSNKITNDDKSNGRYNCWDCTVTLECSYVLESELKSLGMYKLYTDYIHPVLFSLARMSQVGTRLNMDKRNKLKEVFQKEIDEINKWTEKKYAKKINFDSPKQVKELLYEKEKFPEQIGKNKKVTTDAEALKKLVKRYPREEVLKKLLRYRKVSKLVGTYLSSRVSEDGALRTSFDASGTGTGRISSSQSIKKEGANLQNIPYSIRPLFIAREGYTLIEGDLSQAETLVVAELLARLGYPSLVERYEDPAFDIHSWAASGIFNRPAVDIDKSQRNIGKLSNHSGNYGAGPGVLVSQSIKREIEYNGQIGIDYAFSKRILEKRHTQLPGLKVWWADVERRLKTTRCIETIFGRKRYFFGRLDKETYRTAYAFEPQSTIGDLTNRIIIRLDKKLESSLLIPDFHILMQVHDSIMFEVPDACVSESIRIFRECAKIPMHFNYDRKPLIVPLDVCVGKVWGEMTEV
jgi:DNA polymerase I-like protein with 3'-5' exonuclease and polymerase domains